MIKQKVHKLLIKKDGTCEESEYIRDIDTSIYAEGITIGDAYEIENEDEE